MVDPGVTLDIIVSDRNRVANDGLLRLLTVIIRLPEPRHELASCLVLAERVASDRVLVRVGLLGRLGEGAMRTNIARADSLGSITEDERADNVQETKCKAQNASCQDKLPEGQTHLIAAIMGLVELPKNVAADEKHSQAKPGKA